MDSSNVSSSVCTVSDGSSGVRYDKVINGMHTLSSPDTQASSGLVVWVGWVVSVTQKECDTVSSADSAMV